MLSANATVGPILHSRVRSLTISSKGRDRCRFRVRKGHNILSFIHSFIHSYIRLFTKRRCQSTLPVLLLLIISLVLFSFSSSAYYLFRSIFIYSVSFPRLFGFRSPGAALFDFYPIAITVPNNRSSLSESKSKAKAKAEIKESPRCASQRSRSSAHFPQFDKEEAEESSEGSRKLAEAAHVVPNE